MQIIKEMEYPQFLKGESKLWWNYLVSKKGASFVAGALASYMSSSDNKKFNTFLKDLFLKVKQGEDNAKKARDARRDNDLLGDDEDLVEVTEDDTTKEELDRAAMEDLLAQGEQFWDENGDAIRKGLVIWWNKMTAIEKCNVIAKYRIETSHFAKTLTFSNPSGSAGKQILTCAGIPNYQGYPTVFREMQRCEGKLYYSDDPYDKKLLEKMEAAGDKFAKEYGRAFSDTIIQQLSPSIA